jgi:hypothetical protein
MNRKLELEDILEGREETIVDLRTKLREAIANIDRLNEEVT